MQRAHLSGRDPRGQELSAAPSRAAVKGIAHHPIVEDGVIIYSGATILGRTRLGRGTGTAAVPEVQSLSGPDFRFI